MVRIRAWKEDLFLIQSTQTSFVTYPAFHSKFLPNILISLDTAFADDAHTAEGQVYDLHETKENFWVSELADEDQQRPKRRTIYNESRYVTK